MTKNPLLIAEVKTKSPFGFKSHKSWDELFEIANKYGDIISIHTDVRWGGSFDLIKKAKQLTNKPILAKGIHKTDDDVQKAIDAGADYILVVGRIPQIYKERCLIEPLTLDELKNIPNDLKVVWNSRNLSDGSLKKETFKQARKIFDGWLCQASNIKSVDDVTSLSEVNKNADAILVGEHLESFLDIK